MFKSMYRLALIAGFSFLLPVGVNAIELAEKPIFCKLSSDELRLRLGELRAEFITQIVAVDEHPYGFTYWFDNTPERIQMLAEFVDFESKCCGFMDFQIVLAGEKERMSLTMSGPDGTKSFLEDMMTSIEFDWTAGL